MAWKSNQTAHCEFALRIGKSNHVSRKYRVAPQNVPCEILIPRRKYLLNGVRCILNCDGSNRAKWQINMQGMSGARDGANHHKIGAQSRLSILLEIPLKMFCYFWAQRAVRKISYFPKNIYRQHKDACFVGKLCQLSLGICRIKNLEFCKYIARSYEHEQTAMVIFMFQDKETLYVLEHPVCTALSLFGFFHFLHHKAVW